jgi:DNA-directed RNA polymerase specialized sigma24 family protein
MKGTKENQQRKPLVSDEYWHATETRDALRAGYLETAQLAEKQMHAAEERGDHREAREYEKMMRYALRKAGSSYPESDIGDNHSLYSYTEKIGTREQLETDLTFSQDGEEIPEYDRSDMWSREGKYAIAGAMALLTPMQRTIFKLYHLEGVRRTAAAGLMNMNLATFDTHIRDINRRLRNYVSNLDTIAQECDVEAESLLIRLRGEQRLEAEKLRKKNQELRAQQDLRNRQLFDAACRAGALTDDETTAYRRHSIDGVSRKTVALEMGLGEDEFDELFHRANLTVMSVSRSVEVRVVPKSQVG